MKKVVIKSIDDITKMGGWVINGIKEDSGIVVFENGAFVKQLKRGDWVILEKGVAPAEAWTEINSKEEAIAFGKIMYGEINEKP